MRHRMCSMFRCRKNSIGSFATCLHQRWRQICLDRLIRAGKGRPAVLASLRGVVQFLLCERVAKREDRAAKWEAAVRDRDFIILTRASIHGPNPPFIGRKSIRDHNPRF